MLLDMRWLLPALLLCGACTSTAPPLSLADICAGVPEDALGEPVVLEGTLSVTRRACTTALCEPTDECCNICEAWYEIPCPPGSPVEAVLLYPSPELTQPQVDSCWAGRARWNTSIRFGCVGHSNGLTCIPEAEHRYRITGQLGGPVARPHLSYLHRPEPSVTSVAVDSYEEVDTAETP